MKQSHELYKCQNIYEVRNYLHNIEVDIDEIIAKHIKEGKEYGSLICGSLTDGNANKSSDLDIIVLIDSDSDLLKDSKIINLNVENTKEVLSYYNGIEINIIFKPWGEMRKIIEDFITIAPALYNPKDVDCFPVISREKLQFLHNLRNGWVLSGDKIIERWRDECMVEILPIYLAVHHFLISIELLEDAISVDENIKGSSTFIGKMCLEHLFLAILAKENFTNQNRKWIFHNGVKIQNKEAMDLFNKMFNLFFISHDLDQENEYVKNVKNSVLETMTLLNEDLSIGEAIRYILETINYNDLKLNV